MLFTLFFATSFVHALKKNDEPIPDPTQTPYATIISTKPTLAIALSTCIACIVFMIIATSVKCILKTPDEELDGMQEQLLVTRDNLMKE